MSTLVAPKPYGSSIPWTDERISQLKRLHQVGLMPSEIGRMIGGLSRARVQSKLFELGLIAKEPPNYEREAPVAVPKEKPAERPVSVYGPPIRQRNIRPERLDVAQIANSDINAARTCAFPLGDPGSPDFRYCGNALVVGGQSAYCVHHHGQVYKSAPSDDFDRLLKELGE